MLHTEEDVEAWLGPAAAPPGGRVDGRGGRRPPRRRRGGGGPRRPRPPRRLRGPPDEAVVRPVPAESGSDTAHRPSPRRPDGSPARPAAGVGRARRLPPGQLHHDQRRDGRRRAGLGDLAPSATPWPTSATCWPPGRSRATQFATISTSPSKAPGFSTRADLAAHYAARSDLDCSAIPFYAAFSYWKLACINQGVWARYDAGQKSTEGVDVDAIRSSVDQLAQQAAEAFAAVRPT